MKATAPAVILILLALLVCGQLASADRGIWPTQIDFGIGVTSRSDSRLQVMAEGSGTAGEDLTLRIGGWLVHGDGSTTGHLSNAYVGLDKPNFYAAAGQKFVVFGPAGLMVSPGARGAEVVLKGSPISLQLLGGRTQFTPPTGHCGRTTPNLEPGFGEDREHKEFFAARVEYDLPRGVSHTYLGLNTLWASSRNGVSADVETPAGEGRTLYGEISSFDSDGAELVGMRFPDVGKYFDTTKETTLDVFWRRIPEDYYPSIAAASQYYADSYGLGVGLHHKMSSRSALGVYGDNRGVMVNFYRQFLLSD
jgi:hypothetical protein